MRPQRLVVSGDSTVRRDLMVGSRPSRPGQRRPRQRFLLWRIQPEPVVLSIVAAGDVLLPLLDWAGLAVGGERPFAFLLALGVPLAFPLGDARAVRAGGGG